jgi:hypothetical protein
VAISTQPCSTSNLVGLTRDLDTTTARDVRHVVCDLLDGQAGLMVDDAILVTDELVSNAHQHGTAPRVCRLALINQGLCLRIEVGDASSRQPKIRIPDLSGGRGLFLVDRLASSWGVTGHQDQGKTVWAELILGPRETSSPPERPVRSIGCERL